MTCCAPSRDSDRPAGGADPAAAAPAPGPNGRGMVRLDGGRFLMGTDSADAIPGDGETPVREIFVDPFRIEACAVSNADFAAFVDATGYQTDSERLGWSFVFEGRLSRKLRRTAIEDRLPGARWWCKISGADWRRPEGPGSSIARRAAPGTRNPRGPATGTARVTCGGSYLCHVSYCSRYRLSARTHNTPDSAAGHMGFRRAADVC